MKSKKVLSILLICMFFLLSSQVASAKTMLTEDEWDQRREYINQNIKELGGQGQEAIESFLEANGIVKLSESDSMNISESLISPMSVAGSVDLYVNFWYDQYAGKYVVQGGWEWQSLSYIDNKGGAVDGISLTMYQTNFKPVTGYVYSSYPAYIQVYDQNGWLYDNAGSASSISNSGIAWTFQDAWQIGAYCGYSGIVWFYLDEKPSQSPMYIGINFTHTWSDATLSSFGITWPTNNLPSLNMSFTSTPKSFTKTTQTTVYSWPRL